MQRKHIVDVLIEERAPRLSRSMLWPLIREPLFAVLDYAGARRMADAIADLDGPSALAHVSAMLRLDLSLTGVEHLPRTGRCIVVANHPTGVADGIAVADAIARVRADARYFANADALRICPALIEIVIPVEWLVERRTFEKTKLMLSLARKALEEERVVVIFPAGAIARRSNGQGAICELEWERSAVALARRYGAPVAPLHVRGPFPLLYHCFDLFSRELRNVTLFRELLNKKGRRYRLTLGPLIEPVHLRGETGALTRSLREYVVHTLGRGLDIAFTP